MGHLSAVCRAAGFVCPGVSVCLKFGGCRRGLEVRCGDLGGYGAVCRDAVCSVLCAVCGTAL